MITPPCVVTDAGVLGHYRLRLTFCDGLAGHAGLPDLRDWDGVFTPLRHPGAFAQVRADPETGTITWPGGADLAPEVLYHRASAHPRRASPRLDCPAEPRLDLPIFASRSLAALE